MAYSSLTHRLLKSPILLMWWYGVLSLLSLITLLVWARTEDRLSSGRRSLFIGFVVVSLAVYFTAGSTSLMWASRKGLSKESRDTKMQVAVFSMWVVSDMPFVIVHCVVGNEIGFVNVLQGMDWALRGLSAALGFLFLWVIYLSKFADYYHAMGYRRPPLEANPAVHSTQGVHPAQSAHGYPAARSVGGYGPGRVSGGVHYRAAGGGDGGGGGGPVLNQPTYSLNAVGGFKT